MLWTSYHTPFNIGGVYLWANQWRALVQEYGPVFCLQQLRAWGSQALVGFFVDPLTPTIVKSQTNIGITLALKAAASFRHHCLERAAAAEHIEVVQRGVRPLADIQFNAYGSQLLHQVGNHEAGRDHVMPEIADGCELSIVPSKNHERFREPDLGDDVKKRAFAHEYFVQTARP